MKNSVFGWLVQLGESIFNTGKSIFDSVSSAFNTIGKITEVGIDKTAVEDSLFAQTIKKEEAIPWAELNPLEVIPETNIFPWNWKSTQPYRAVVGVGYFNAADEFIEVGKTTLFYDTVPILDKIYIDADVQLSLITQKQYSEWDMLPSGAEYSVGTIDFYRARG
jgi:hypothetical protein